MGSETQREAAVDAAFEAWLNGRWDVRADPFGAWGAGYDSGFAAGLRRAAEIARERLLTTPLSPEARAFNTTLEMVAAAILAECPEGSE